jgi:Fe-S-cluster containining protein
VPLSPPEAFRISEEVTALPVRHRGRIVERYVRAAQTVLRAGPPRVADSLHPQVGFDETLARVSRWYAGLELDCPFLVRRICAIYAARPLACREHVVTHDPDRCADPQHAPVEGQVAQPVSIAVALSALAGEVEGADPEAVMLPLAMMWAQEQRQRAERTYPAVELFRRLADILRRQAGSAEQPLAQTA